MCASPDTSSFTPHSHSIPGAHMVRAMVTGTLRFQVISNAIMESVIMSAVHNRHNKYRISDIAVSGCKTKKIRNPTKSHDLDDFFYGNGLAVKLKLIT